MAPELLHLTLVFLGQTDTQRLDSIVAAVSRVAARHAPYAATTGAAAGRADERPTPRRPGVAWLELALGAPQTARLMLDLDVELDARTYAQRPPRPHLTVARRLDRRALDDLRALAPSLRVGWQVERIVLFRSHTGPRGPRYEEIADAALTPAPPSA